MSNQMRVIISKSTLLLVAAALLYSGIFCINKARALHADEVQRQAAMPNPRTKMNGGYLFIGAVGIILALGGTVSAFGAVAPSSWIERLLGRPTNTTLHEQDWPVDMID